MKCVFFILFVFVSASSAQTPADGQKDFDFEIGTWKTSLRRLVKPLTGSTTWVGWRNLSAAEVQVAKTDEAWHDPQLLKLFDAEREWFNDCACDSRGSVVRSRQISGGGRVS